MTTAPPCPALAAYLDARRAFGAALTWKGEASAAAEGRAYLRAKNALISDIIEHGDADTETHSYSVLWCPKWRCWQLTVMAFTFSPGGNACSFSL